MTHQPIHPLYAPPLADLKNALQVAQVQIDEPMYGGAGKAFARIAELLRHALESLSEPSLAAMQAGEILLKEWHGTPEPQRQLRDTLAGILNAQLTGQIPQTWSHE